MPNYSSPTQDARIVAIVRQFLAKNSLDHRPLTRDDVLEEAGLTSLDIVNLMLAVEAEFDLTIPGMALIPANFRSISTIDRLVSNLLRDAQPVAASH
jgi:acyl carrier protein